MDTKTLKNDLKDVLDSGVSQMDVARCSGVPQPLISRFINTDGAGVSMKNVWKLVSYVYGPASSKSFIGPQDREG